VYECDEVYILKKSAGSIWTAWTKFVFHQYVFVKVSCIKFQEFARINRCGKAFFVEEKFIDQNF
jgi:hypothetical protein